jgi:hypothetical protein
VVALLKRDGNIMVIQAYRVGDRDRESKRILFKINSGEYIVYSNL